MSMSMSMSMSMPLDIGSEMGLQGRDATLVAEFNSGIGAGCGLDPAAVTGPVTAPIPLPVPSPPHPMGLQSCDSNVSGQWETYPYPSIKQELPIEEKATCCSPSESTTSTKKRKRIKLMTKGAREQTKNRDIAENLEKSAQPLEDVQELLEKHMEYAANYPNVPMEVLEEHLPSTLDVKQVDLKKHPSPVLAHHFYDSLQLKMDDIVIRCITNLVHIVQDFNKAYRHRRVNAQRLHLADSISYEAFKHTHTRYQLFRASPEGRRFFGPHMFPVKKSHYGTTLAPEQTRRALIQWESQLSKQLQNQRQMETDSSASKTAKEAAATATATVTTQGLRPSQEQSVKPCAT